MKIDKDFVFYGARINYRGLSGCTPIPIRFDIELSEGGNDWWCDDSGNIFVIEVYNYGERGRHHSLFQKIRKGEFVKDESPGHIDVFCKDCERLQDWINGVVDTMKMINNWSFVD